MKLLLTSKGLTNEAIKEKFLSFVGERKTVALVITAAKDFKEKNKNIIALKATLEALAFQVRLVDFEFEDPKILEESQIIIISGGNPYYLLHHIKKSKADIVLRRIVEKNIPLMGISAGSLVLMKDLAIIDCLSPQMNTINLRDKNALHLIDEIIVPHYDRFVKEGIIKKPDIDDFEIKTKSKVIRLGEFQCLIYQDQEQELMGDLQQI